MKFSTRHPGIGGRYEMYSPTPVVKKAWGYEVHIVNKNYCGKILHFNKGTQGSLHFHLKKIETFFLQSGHIRVQLRDSWGFDKFVEMLPGESIDILPGMMHRVFALEDSDIFEFSTTDFPDDSYRVERSS